MSGQLITSLTSAIVAAIRAVVYSRLYMSDIALRGLYLPISRRSNKEAREPCGARANPITLVMWRRLCYKLALELHSNEYNMYSSTQR